jgi:hypothetical protein
MLLKTLDVQMAPVGDEVELTFNITFEVQDEDERRVPWVMPVTIVGYGQKWIPTQGYPQPVPEVKQHSFVLDHPNIMSLPDSAFDAQRVHGRCIFRTRVKKAAILVENFDQYIFQCRLRPLNPIPDSNVKMSVVVQDID